MPLSATVSRSAPKQAAARVPAVLGRQLRLGLGLGVSGGSRGAPRCGVRHLAAAGAADRQRSVLAHHDGEDDHRVAPGTDRRLGKVVFVRSVLIRSSSPSRSIDVRDSVMRHGSSCSPTILTRQRYHPHSGLRCASPFRLALAVDHAVWINVVHVKQLLSDYSREASAVIRIAAFVVLALTVAIVPQAMAALDEGRRQVRSRRAASSTRARASPASSSATRWRA